MDGSLVILQILQGVLKGAAMNNDEISGTPPGAIRYCPAHMIATLDPGLTISLYDVRSGRTRAVHVDGRSILRVATTFGHPELNTPVIANALLSNASEIIRINRVGIDCTGFILDMNGLKALSVGNTNTDDDEQEEEPEDEVRVEKAGIKLSHAGRKQVTVSASKRRILKARALLAAKNIPLCTFAEGDSAEKLAELRRGVDRTVRLV